jgi:heme iron utilization protein
MATSDASATPPDRLARSLLRRADRAVLATRLGPEGWPYASLVLLAVAPDAAPILLLSDLAEHSRALAADARLSLLIDGTAGHDDPLTGPRLTLLGTAARTTVPGDSARFLNRHESARLYAGFGDFHVYRIAVSRAHLVAGFGRIHWLEGTAVGFDASGATALVEHEGDILAHMNADHGAAVELMAARLAGAGGTGWRMTGIDPEGCDFARPGATARIDFATPIDGPERARAELVRLARLAREGAWPRSASQGFDDDGNRG